MTSKDGVRDSGEQSTERRNGGLERTGGSVPTVVPTNTA